MTHEEIVARVNDLSGEDIRPYAMGLSHGELCQHVSVFATRALSALDGERMPGAVSVRSLAELSLSLCDRD